MKRLGVFCTVAVMAMLLAACNDSRTEPTGPQELEFVSGLEATPVAGAVLVPTVRLSQGSSAVTGTRVRFTVVEGGGSLSTATAVTDGEGLVRVFWLLGPEPGSQRLRAQVGTLAEEFEVRAGVLEPGSSYHGRNEYNEYQPGTLPIIISVPHDGTLKPDEMPDRTGGDGVGIRDIYARNLVMEIAESLEELTGERPHLIANSLGRIKVEPNAAIERGAQGDSLAERAWYEYHNWIDVAKYVVTRDHGKGFYVDIHGHAHPIARNELGYLLNSTDLAHSDELLVQTPFIEKSSVANLARRDPSSFPDLIRGPTSLGDLLVRRGYPSIPSSSDPAPAGTAYFNGGYSTGRHGSRDGGTIDGVQIETPGPGVRNNARLRATSGRAFAEALVEYMGIHYGFDLAR